MLGSGSVRTSSPTWPTTERPCSSKLSTLTPRERHWISPRRARSSQEDVTDDGHNSPPPPPRPGVDPPRPGAAAAYHGGGKPAGGGDGPAGPIECRADRPASRAG